MNAWEWGGGPTLGTQAVGRFHLSLGQPWTLLLLQFSFLGLPLVFLLHFCFSRHCTPLHRGVSPHPWPLPG